MNIDMDDFFQQVTTFLCSSLDIEKSLSKCYNYIKKTIPVKSISLSWYDSQSGIFHGIAYVDSTSCRRIHPNFPLPRKLCDLYDTIQFKHNAVIFQKSKDSHFLSLLRSVIPIEGKSLLALPLAVEGSHVGVVTLSSLSEDAFTNEHKKILSFVHDPFAIAVSNCKKHEEIIELKDALYADNQFLIGELNRSGREDIVGENFGLKDVFSMVRQVATKDCPVLLLGETGVGKEIIANRLHFSSERKSGPFIKVNCGAISESLIDSELFGYEKGAFTGANQLKKGRFERAFGGTIFLDEIGELPLSAQVRLLRVIQQKEIERVGGSETIPLDIRIVAATHRDLDEMVEKGEFREDLLFRLNVFPIEIPPLRKRRMDIPALIGYFLKKKCKKLNIEKIPPLLPDSIEELMEYEWKGNVRELENEVERALIRYNGEEGLFFDCLVPSQKDSFKFEQDHGEIELNKVISMHINDCLKFTKGKINGPDGAAELLDINPSTLRNKMKKLGISYERKKYH